jgi:hypothetical protein
MKSTPSLVWLVVSASCFVLSFAKAVDWPQWRGINRDGISSETISPASWGKDGPQQLWKKGVGTGVSSVAVTGGRLYTMGNNGNMDMVFCLDANTGAEIWRHAYPQPLDDRSFEGGPAGTPTVDGDKVYTLSHEGDLFCLAASTGTVVWKKNLPRDFNGFRQKFGYAGSPLVEGNLVIVDSGGVGASTVALDKTTGEVRWKASHDEAGYSSPVAFDLGGVRCAALLFSKQRRTGRPERGQRRGALALSMEDEIRHQRAHTPGFRRQNFHHLRLWHRLRFAAGAPRGSFCALAQQEYSQPARQPRPRARLHLWHRRG